MSTDSAPDSTISPVPSSPTPPPPVGVQPSSASDHSDQDPHELPDDGSIDGVADDSERDATNIDQDDTLEDSLDSTPSIEEITKRLADLDDAFGREVESQEAGPGDVGHD